MNLADDLLIGFLAGRKSRKARFIEGVVYRDLKAKEDARVAAEKAAFWAARPRLAQAVNRLKFAGLALFVFLMSFGYAISPRPNQMTPPAHVSTSSTGQP